MPRLLLALALAAWLAPGPSAAYADTAAPLTSEQSDSLARALRLWTLGLAGDPAGYTATPAEGGYDVAIPVQGEIGSTGVRIEGAPITAKASLAADGAWHFDAIALPSPLHVTLAAKPDGTPIQITQTYAAQNGTAMVNPTLTGPSSGEYLHSGIKLRIEGIKTPRTITVAKSSTRIEWVPASPGRVDAGSVTRLDDMAAGGEDPADARGIAIHDVTITTQSSDADPDRASQLARKAMSVVTSMRPKDGDGDGDREFTPEQRATLHALVTQMRDIARGTKQSIAAEGIVVTSDHQKFSLDRATLSQKAEAPDGKADTHMRLELTGLHLPNILPGALGDLLPKHLVIAPYVTGTPIENLYAMADQAIDEKPDASSLAGEAQARLAQTPSTTGIEELSFDLGPAAISAHGEVTTGEPGAMDGKAVVEATGLDALMKRASGDRMLKRAVPVLAFLKGIGEQNGDKVVWNLVYSGGKFTVNGTDISGFLPGK